MWGAGSHRSRHVRRVAGVSGLSVHVAPFPGVAPGVSGVQAPADPGTSAVVAGDGGSGIHVAPLPDLA